MSETESTEHIIFVKNLPKHVSDLVPILKHFKPPIIKMVPFGRRRALLHFENGHQASEAIEEFHHQTLMGKKLTAAIFCKTKPEKLNKNTQTNETNKNETAVSTPKICKQLGFLETIYVDGSQQENNNTSTKSKSHKSKLNTQPFNYVIAVDFEATCWESQAPPKWRESEIIEFPAVLINLKSGKIEAEFHKYIMPIESPKLSAFCTDLTGIEQKTVDTGMPLQTALMMFNEWLRKELRARNLSLPKMSKENKIGNCAFVTWSDWDFGICLAKECQRKRIKKPPFFNQWIDLRAIYREWYQYRPINFNDALLHVGLTFEGRPHCGLDDAKNLGALTYKMMRDGATLAITKDLTPFQLNNNCML